MIRKNNFLYIVLSFSLALGLIAYAAQYSRVNVGQTVYLGELNKDVRNNCSQDIFVPLNSAAEQASFTSYKPACISFGGVGPYSYSGWSSCSVSCGGGTQTRTQSCSYDRCTDPQATTQSGCNPQSCCQSWTVIAGCPCPPGSDCYGSMGNPHEDESLFGACQPSSAYRGYNVNQGTGCLEVFCSTC